MFFTKKTWKKRFEIQTDWMNKHRGNTLTVEKLVRVRKIVPGRNLICRWELARSYHPFKVKFELV